MISTEQQQHLIRRHCRRPYPDWTGKARFEACVRLKPPTCPHNTFGSQRHMCISACEIITAMCQIRRIRTAHPSHRSQLSLGVMSKTFEPVRGMPNGPNNVVQACPRLCHPLTSAVLPPMAVLQQLPYRRVPPCISGRCGPLGKNAPRSRIKRSHYIYDQGLLTLLRGRTSLSCDTNNILPIETSFVTRFDHNVDQSRQLLVHQAETAWDQHCLRRARR